MSRSGRAHCVRWVAQLYQKTSLVLYRWVTQASSSGLPEAFTCPATLDRPGRLGARSLHSPVSLDRPGRLDFEARWLLRPLSLVVFPPLFFETLAGSDVILPHYRCATTHFPSGPQKKPTTTHTPGTEPLEPRSL